MVKGKHEPVRTCVACREEAGKRSLVRLVRDSDGMARVDLAGRARGRGAYLHSSAECRELARKRRSVERALKATVPPDFWESLTGPTDFEFKGGD